MNDHHSPPARVIKALLQHSHSHTLTIHQKSMPYALEAEVKELSFDLNRIVLEVEYSGTDFENYVSGGGVNFDLEALKETDVTERETYSINKLLTKLHKTDSFLYRLECQLPDSIFINDSRGAVRIPFILGMQARVRIEVYLHKLNITGKLRNFSTSGCMVEIDLVESIALFVGQTLPSIIIIFPDGTSFNAEGKIRHMRPLGRNGYAAVGIEFINVPASQIEPLFHYVNESEREAAYRMGLSGHLVYPSPLFIAGSNEKKIRLREHMDKEKNSRNTPMERGVLEIAQRLQVGLMYVKTRNVFPLEIFYDCADTLIYLVKTDRKALLYALASLRNEPEWVRHAIQVSSRLTDILLRRDPYDYLLREVVLGSLLHTMGKPLLVSESLPSLQVVMNPDHKAILSGHVTALREKMRELKWTPSPACLDIIENANELLNGSGYPAGKSNEQLTDRVRLISVIKAINKLTNARNGISPRPPLEAYKKVNSAKAKYDRHILFEYIQRYGLYPIGSLVKYSGGFLGWVMTVDKKGRPETLHIIKNLHHPDETIHSVVSRGDLRQLGKLQCVVDPAEFGINVIKI
nr:PilZ domain-containing protein [uncultured Enterobacter sp.]